MAMDDARVARALNRLGADAFLLDSDSDGLLELVDEYFGDTPPTGNPTYLITTLMITQK